MLAWTLLSAPATHMRSIWVIGVKKRIIVVNMGLMNVAMLNPVILKKSGPFETEEGCLSLTGTRKTKRFREIELEYQDQDMKKHVQK